MLVGDLSNSFQTVPNQLVVAKKLAILEKAEDALIFASGMAAISSAVYTYMKSGDQAVFSQGIEVNLVMNKGHLNNYVE